jgi:hypothetical protein
VPALMVLSAIVLTLGQAFAQSGTRNRIRSFPWILAGATVVLVDLQLVWLLFRVQANQPLRHLNQDITLTGLNRACSAALVFAIALWVGLVFRSSVRRAAAIVIGAVNPSSEPLRRSHPAVLALGSSSLLLLVFLAGGPVALLTRPGVVVPSQALLLALGRLPLISVAYPRLAAEVRVPRLFLGYAPFYFLVLLANSRILFTFEVLSIAAIKLWCRPTARSLGIGALFLAFVSFLVFFAYGTYRERASNPDSRVAVLSAGPAIGWFYGKNVEAGAGIAGVLSRRVPAPNYGAPTLSATAVQLVPGPIRSTLNLRSPASVSQSVVPSALEDAYLAFRYAGIALLGVFVGSLGAALDHFGRRPDTRAAAAALAPFSLLLVRGSLRDALVFGLSQIILMTVLQLKRRKRVGRTSAIA